MFPSADVPLKRYAHLPGSTEQRVLGQPARLRNRSFQQSERSRIGIKAGANANWQHPL